MASIQLAQIDNLISLLLCILFLILGFAMPRGRGRGRGETSSSQKVPRKIVEKDRRDLMKLLCFKLVSLIPTHLLSQPKELLSQQDQVDHSVAYIEFLRERVEELRRKKAQLKTNAEATDCDGNNMVESKVQPTVMVKDLGFDSLEVVLISGVSKNFKLGEVIKIIEEEAAQVLTLSISTVDAKIIHTIHAQVKVCRVGVDIARISERIHELISSSL